MDDSNENKTNLIVNYLPQQMTDEEFENLFKKFGSMKSCKIVRNKLNGYSYGFGFVDFENHEQALRAIDELNGHDLDNKKIKVAFARPAGQDIKQANLYIKNIPHDWTQENVRKIFEPYGNIIQVRVLGQNRGVAFVLFDLRKQAEDALEALNGQLVDGCDKELEIKFASDKKSDKGNSKNKSISNNNNNSININNNNNRRTRDRGNRVGGGNSMGGSLGGPRRMNNNNSMSDLGPMRHSPANKMNRFAPFVPMVTPTTAPMMAPPLNPVSYGFPNQPQLPQQQPTIMNPYNMMPTQSMAPMQTPVLQASGPPQMMQPQLGMYGTAQIPVGYTTTISQNAMNNIYSVASNNLTNAANMQPQFGQPMAPMRNTSNTTTSGATPGGNDDGVTLFVYNIGPDSDEDELRAIFEPYGQVVKCNVVRKTPGGETKGFGFVTLKDRSQANSAISGLNGSMRNGRALQVSLKK